MAGAAWSARQSWFSTQTSSNSVTASPASIGETLVWNVAPSSVTGGVAVTLHPSKQLTAPMLLVDGNSFGSVGTPAYQQGVNGSTSSIDLEASFDSSALPNGTHTAQVVDLFNNVASPQITFTVNNTVSNADADLLVDQQAGEVANFRTSLPSAYSNWQLLVKDEQGTSVRSYTGNWSDVTIAWDGKDALGADVPDGSYDLALVGNATDGSKVTVTKAQVKLRHAPQFLMLYDLIRGGGANGQGLIGDDLYLSYLRSFAKKMEGLYPGLTVAVFAKSRSNIPKSFVTKVKGWMKNNLTDFYINGHGMPASNGKPQVTKFNTMYFSPTDVYAANGQFYDDAVSGWVNIPSATQGRRYNFVWIDSCVSMGHDPEGDHNASQTLNGDVWANAFNMIADPGDPGSGALMGWNGDCANNTNLTGDLPTIWYRWRKAFLQNLSDGNPVSRATAYATLHCGSDYFDFYPYDTNPNRLVVYGDTWIP